MNDAVCDSLERHFDTAFAAPDGIKKLRELILTLAMQGKLVAQDPNDPPASQLLKEIEAEKKRLVKEGKIKAPKPLPEVKSEEAPYALPQNWKWVRLGETGLINPRNSAEDSKLAGFVPMPLISEGYSEKHQFEERLWGEIKKGYTHFADGDVGMAKITPCFENAKSCVFEGLPNGIGAGTTELHIFRNSFNAIAPRFLLYYLKNPHYISKAASNMTGSAGQKRVPTPYFTEQPFPLPPFPEQHRIVAKIDQLMARCDELEKLRDEREQKRRRVHAAALKQLLDASSSSPRRRGPSDLNDLDSRLRGNDDSFADAWQFITQHFGELYAVRENVTELRKAILQLAVMGKLVPQNPNDPPASQLLKEIEAEKKRLVKEGKIKAPKPLPEIKPEEVPYALPQGWEWVRLGEIGVWKSGSTPSRTNSKYYGGGIPWVKSGEVKQGRISKTEESITELALAECSLSLNPKGSVLVAMYGANIGEVGILNIEATTNQAVCACNTYTAFDERYLLNLIASLKQYFISQGAGAAQPNISREKIVATIFPLPPLPEQHRIVAKIDSLMFLCDALEQQIDAATHKQTALLDAVMAQA